MEFILCYWKPSGKYYQPVWEKVYGEDAMQVRVGELMEELNCESADILVFDMDDQW